MCPRLDIKWGSMDRRPTQNAQELEKILPSDSRYRSQVCQRRPGGGGSRRNQWQRQSNVHHSRLGFPLAKDNTRQRICPCKDRGQCWENHGRACTNREMPRISSAISIRTTRIGSKLLTQGQLLPGMVAWGEDLFLRGPFAVPADPSSAESCSQCQFGHAYPSRLNRPFLAGASGDERNWFWRSSILPFPRGGG